MKASRSPSIRNTGRFCVRSWMRGMRSSAVSMSRSSSTSSAPPPSTVPDYPSESFRVLKEKEIAEFGEYRTMRMVLEAFRKDER